MLWVVVKFTSSLVVLLLFNQRTEKYSIARKSAAYLYVSQKSEQEMQFGLLHNLRFGPVTFN